MGEGAVSVKRRAGRDDRGQSCSLVLRKATTPGTRPQGLYPHQALDLVQATADAVSQDITPDAASAIGSVARLEARIDLGANHLVVHKALARRARQPGFRYR